MTVVGIVYVADGLTRDWGPWRRPTSEERTLVRQLEKLGVNMRMVLPGHGPPALQADVERYRLSIGEPIGSMHRSVRE